MVRKGEMTEQTTTPAAAEPPRAMRADARRNRERILSAARELFATDAHGTSTDDICHRANVGPGTLYRHFSSRTELMAVVHLADLEALTNRAHGLTRTQPGWPALQQWLTEYLDYCQNNRGLLAELDHLLRTEPELNATVAQRTAAAADTAVAHAQHAGAVDPELAGTDLLQFIYGMVLPPDADQARNSYQLDIILTGIRKSDSHGER